MRNRSTAAALCAGVLGLSGCAISVSLPTGAGERTAAPAPVPAPAASSHREHGAGSEESHVNMVVLPSERPRNAATRLAADAFQARVAGAVEDLDLLHPREARAAGYVRMEFDRSHWYHPEHLRDGRLFDPERPEFLVIVGGLTVGVMFVPESMDLDVAEPAAAPYQRWHYHTYPRGYVCVDRGLVTYRVDSRGRCRAGDRAVTRSPLMAHVWVYDARDPFAAMMTSHDLP